MSYDNHEMALDPHNKEHMDAVLAMLTREIKTRGVHKVEMQSDYEDVNLAEGSEPVRRIHRGLEITLTFSKMGNPFLSTWDGPIKMEYK